MRFLIYLVVVSVLFTGCANRGYTISQQVPGYDNNFDRIEEGYAYRVDQEGQIYDQHQVATTTPARTLALADSAVIFSNSDPVMPANLDTDRGAVFLGKSSIKVTAKKLPNYPSATVP